MEICSGWVEDDLLGLNFECWFFFCVCDLTAWRSGHYVTFVWLVVWRLWWTVFMFCGQGK